MPSSQPEENQPLELSIVVPVFNEEEALPQLIEKLLESGRELKTGFEIILCNDGSSDRSGEILDRADADHITIRAVHFRRNFGQTAALDAGFKHAQGRYVVAIDADLQNDPSDIALLLEKARQGADVVKGWRKDRKDPFLTRILPSKIANWIIGRVTGVELHDYGCTLTLYKREVLQEFNLYGEMHRFIPVYAHSVGAEILEVPVKHHPRTLGTSKYGLSRTFRVLFDLLTVSLILGYNTKPLYFFGKIGVTAMILGSASWTWTIVKKIIWQQPLFTDPFFSTGTFLMLIGMQVLLFGLLAEITVRTYFESQGKTSWILKHTSKIKSPGNRDGKERPESD